MSPETRSNLPEEPHHPLPPTIPGDHPEDTAAQIAHMQAISIQEIINQRHLFEYNDFFPGIEIIDKKGTIDRLIEVIRKLNLDPNKIKVINLPGKQFGESSPTEEIYLDPRALNFTTAVIGLILAHEKLHHGDRVPNEALVHATAEEEVKKHFGIANVTLTPEYQGYLQRFELYLKHYPNPDKLPRPQLLHTLLGLYLQRDFDALYDPFIHQFPPEERDEAQSIFHGAFPNLSLIS